MLNVRSLGRVYSIAYKFCVIEYPALQMILLLRLAAARVCRKHVDGAVFRTDGEPAAVRSPFVPLHHGGCSPPTEIIHVPRCRLLSQCVSQAGEVKLIEKHTSERAGCSGSAESPSSFAARSARELGRIWYTFTV